MVEERPSWFPLTSEFCKVAGIKILASGPESLVVEAKSPQRAAEIASQLSQFGFKTIQDDDDANAGMLTLSRIPEAVRPKGVLLNFSRRPWLDQIEPLFLACCSLVLIGGFAKRLPWWESYAFGSILFVLFLWRAALVWGWRLQIQPEGLRIRRSFRWSTIPWDRIRSAESELRGRNQERITLKLVSDTSERLGTFGVPFARNLRDRLRNEIAQRRST